MQRPVVIVTALLASSCAAIKIETRDQVQRDASTESAENAANPIRKVVKLLQKMQTQITAEAKKEKDLYEKFSCYCKNGDASLSASISTATAKVGDVGASIQEGEARKAQLEIELKDHQSSRSDAKAAVAQASALREKEADAFSKESSEYKTNIAALVGAITAIDKGMAGGFLQTRTVSVLRKLVLNGPAMSDSDRQELLAFLSAQQGVTTASQYIPQSGEISGILKQLKDDMSKSLADIESEENEAIQSYQQLMSAKQKEITALGSSIEAKTTLVGELAVRIVAEKNDLSDTEAAMLQDKKFLADLSKDCDQKAKEMEERVQTRAAELSAIADTIKVLNDDDALELFKKTLPTPGFLQMEVNSDKTRKRALEMIARGPFSRKAQDVPSHAGVQLDLISLALNGRKAGFDKVIKMIDNLVALLKQEQVDDESKKDYCVKQLDKSDDKKKGLQQTIADEEASISDAEETMATLESEIKALEEGVRTLDKSVQEATEQRKREHDEYTELIANDSAAKELIVWAKNRLAKFYTPKLYKAPPKRVLSDEEQIFANNGGELEPSLAQVSSRLQQLDAPAPPPATWDAYSAKSDQSQGVVAMLNLLMANLDKEMAEAGVEEKNAQSEYEALMSDSSSKRAADSRSITGKQSMYAGVESALESHKENKASAGKELMATRELIASLHSECDWLLQYFDTRKSARASEIEALGNAKAVLSGADFSLIQRGKLMLKK